MRSGLKPIYDDLISLGQHQYKGWVDIKLQIADAIGYAGRFYTEVKNILAAIDKFTGADPIGSLATKLGARGLGRALGISDPAKPPEVQGPPAPEVLPAITVENDKSKGHPEHKRAERPEAEKEDPVDTFIKNLERSSAALKAETEAYGKSNAEKQIAVDLAKAMEIAKQNDRSLTDAEIARIRATAQAAGDAKDRLAEMGAASQRAAEAIRSFGEMGTSALSDMILEGKSFNDVLSSMVKQLAKWSLQAALTGSGPLAGLFGTAPAAGGIGASSVGGLFGALFGGGPGSNGAGAVAALAGARVGAGSNPIGDIGRYATAIKAIESGGGKVGGENYSAVNGTTGALGAYQVMPANVSSWTKQALGQSITPSEFLKDKGAQDSVFAKIFGASVAKHGNPQDAASVWFTGRPMREAGGSVSDGITTKF